MATLHQKSHRLKVMTTNSRNAIILSTLVFSVLSTLIVFIPDYNYQAHYLIAFFRSFLIFNICIYAIVLTASIRLFGLIILVLTSMTLDFALLMEPSLFWSIKSGRELFSSIYTGFELLAITYTGLSYMVVGIANVVFSKAEKNNLHNT